MGSTEGSTGLGLTVVGLFVVGTFVGLLDGIDVGSIVVGTYEGSAVGTSEGSSVGLIVGAVLGCIVGTHEIIGATEGDVLNE